MQSNAKQCEAMQSNPRQCKAMQTNAKQCKAMQSNAKQCKAMQSKAKQCKALSVAMPSAWPSALHFAVRNPPFWGRAGIIIHTRGRIFCYLSQIVRGGNFLYKSYVFIFNLCYVFIFCMCYVSIFSLCSVRCLVCVM